MDKYKNYVTALQNVSLLGQLLSVNKLYLLIISNNNYDTFRDEICIYKTTELKLKLGRGIYMGKQDEDPTGESISYKIITTCILSRSAVTKEDGCEI